MVRQDAKIQGGGGQPDGEARRGARMRRASSTHSQAWNQLRSGSLEETQRLGAQLGRLLAAGDVVLLTGTLGAGKTAFTQGIGAGLGVRETVNSPTFMLVKEYAGRLPLYHFDLYRIEEPEELYALGFEEYFGGDGVAVVEWAERGEDARGAVWPANWLRVALRAGVSRPTERTLDLSAQGARGQALLAEYLAAACESGLGSPARSADSKESAAPLDANVGHASADHASVSDTAGEGA
jgi:tRNA threonylcarbamoyladenosine biosynthesis protein TsaE